MPATAQLLNVPGEAVSQGIQRLLEGERLVRQTLAGIVVIYLPALFEAEQYCTQRLLEFAALSFPEPRDWIKRYGMPRRRAGWTTPRNSSRRVREAAASGLLLVTGGRAREKTTILRGILSLLGQMQLRCLLAAPTGRAAKRLTEVTGEDASTIHGCWRRESTPTPEHGFRPGRGQPP